MRKAISTILILLALIAYTPLAFGSTAKSVSTSGKPAGKLHTPKQQDSFTFVIFGDTTAAAKNSREVLAKAVSEINIICPDFVINVGDMIRGYNDTQNWIAQMKEYRAIIDKLKCPWFPVVGNHDIYYHGEDKPEYEHEKNFETYFGPLWYSFEYKNCCFIALFSDEGHPDTHKKSFTNPAAQKMSTEQTKWLTDTLKKAGNANHIFIFLHHPRWTGGSYGDDWRRIHNILKKTGKPITVFAGHTHRMYYYGKKNKIEYYTLGTTGGEMSPDHPAVAFFHHYDLVTVRGKDYHIARIPVGSITDPKMRETKTLDIMPRQNWTINSEKTRTLKYPISVPDFPNKTAVLKIAVSHPFDNTGDKGLRFSLLDSDGKVIRKGFISSRKTHFIRHKVRPGTSFTLRLTDEDTSFTGQHPGNKGTLQIQLELATGKAFHIQQMFEPQLKR